MDVAWNNLRLGRVWPGSIAGGDFLSPASSPSRTNAVKSVATLGAHPAAIAT
jgi:hypothetical protein